MGTNKCEGINFNMYNFIPLSGTVRMNEMPRFYVAKLLLHHYRSDFCSYFRKVQFND